MNTQQNSLVIGVFHNGEDAKQALDNLRDAGFAKDQIGLAFRDSGVEANNLVNDLMQLGVPQDRANYYNEAYKAGQPVVSVRADGREQEASTILNTYGAMDTEAPTTDDAPPTSSTIPEEALSVNTYNEPADQTKSYPDKNL